LNAPSLKSKTAGFLLVEALMATTVLLVGLLAVYGAFQKSLEATRAANEHFEAMLLLEEALWSLESSGVRAEASDDGGGLTDPVWTVTSQPADSARWKEWTVALSWTGPRLRQQTLTLTAQRKTP
jgi:Tfp pilus assembly protein PilV